MKEELAEFLELVNQADEFKELADAVVVKLGLFTPIFDKLFSQLTDWLITKQGHMLTEYMDAGFSREEAFRLLLNARYGLHEIQQNRKK